MEVSDHCWDSIIDELTTAPSSNLVNNVETQIRVETCSMNVRVPVSINETEYENSYVCSPYTAYISYAEEELSKVSLLPIRLFLRLLIKFMELPLKLSKINKIVFVNNWLLSTNLYSKIGLEDVQYITKKYLKDFPDHYLAWRSLNSRSNSELIETLKELGYDLIPSRQVYFFPKELNFEDHQNSKRDLKLLKEKTFEIQKVSRVSNEDIDRFVELYNQLYLNKYSFHNPQFNQNFLKTAIRSGAMTFYGLRDSEGVWQGIVGYFIRNGIMTTPIVGYNTSQPQSLGLYRRLIAITLRDAKSFGVDLNLSSGGSSFKILRGGQPFIEYTAIYRRHLPKSRQMLILVLNTLLTRLGVPVMQRFKL